MKKQEEVDLDEIINQLEVSLILTLDIGQIR